MSENGLDQAQKCAISYDKVVQEIPVSLEGSWNRSQHRVAIKFNELSAALPEGSELSADGLGLFVADGAGWRCIPFQINYTDGFGRWQTTKTVTPDTQFCFFTEDSVSVGTGQPDVAADGFIELELWDSQNRAWQQGYTLAHGLDEERSEAIPGSLFFKESDAGISVMDGDEKRLHFSKDRGWQLDHASLPGKSNMIPDGTLWRWALTETFEELNGSVDDEISFTPIVTAGSILVAAVKGETRGGKFSAVVRVFKQAGQLVTEFSDYRSCRSRPELSEEEHPRCYAGQQASPYPNINYLAFLLSSNDPDTVVYDHLYKFQSVDTSRSFGLVYEGALKQKGYSWICLSTGQGTAGITVHGRTHYPDHPFKAGCEDGKTLLGLEPFGSVVDDRYQSCDRYMFILGESASDIESTFASLDTYPILCRLPIVRQSNFLDSYRQLAKWFSMSDRYLMKDGVYRSAVRTDGTYLVDTATCMVPLSEFILLYQKTGDPELLKQAEAAANHIADWILDGKFGSRGEGIHPNGGGIYQSEQIYLLLALARTAGVTGEEKLKRAIRCGVDWMVDHRGNENPWGWPDYLWHGGGYDAEGKALFHWPVNTNEFATLNLRLHQLLGDDYYYAKFKEIIQDYKDHITPGSTEIIKGGGVSDTTRGIHFLTEIMEAAETDPELDGDFWKEALEKTLDRFWVEGWIQIRNSIYAEVIHSGDTPGERFSPGFHHWHNVGSYLDIAPRIQIGVEGGVSEVLSRWAIRDFALDFDSRYGLEEHTHFSRFGIRDSDIEPASGLDPELFATIAAAHKEGWIEPRDMDLLLFKIHSMIQHTFIELDDECGGWPACIDAHDGKPVKYLGYWEDRHSHERFKDQEPLECWGVATREAFHDHSTRYWSHLEQLVDNLATVSTQGVVNGTQIVEVAFAGLSKQLPGAKAAFVPRDDSAETVAVADGQSVILHESHAITLAGRSYWLLAVEA